MSWKCPWISVLQWRIRSNAGMIFGFYRTIKSSASIFCMCGLRTFSFCVFCLWIINPECSSQLKRVEKADKQCKPLLEKNKLLSRKNDELSHSLQRMEDKLKSITKENLEMVGSSLFSNISANLICILKCRFNVLTLTTHRKASQCCS